MKNVEPKVKQKISKNNWIYENSFINFHKIWQLYNRYYSCIASWLATTTISIKWKQVFRPRLPTCPILQLEFHSKVHLLNWTACYPYKLAMRLMMLHIFDLKWISHIQRISNKKMFNYIQRWKRNDSRWSGWLV